jgi:hypothetical protein
MENKTLSDKIVGSQGYEYAFLFADVKEFIKRLKEEIRKHLKKSKDFKAGFYYVAIITMIDKLAGDKLK